VVIATTREPPYRPRLPVDADRAVLLQWVREWCPDLRIKRVTLADGKLAVGARFAFRGETIEVEAVESDELADPDDAIVRRAAWLLWQRMGLRPDYPAGERRRVELQILEAARAGRTEEADRLAQQLAMSNAGMTPQGPLVKTQFENLGGSMFGRQ
jgi:hypothetical protein